MNQIVLKDYKFVLCVDPKTATYYSINLQTYDIHLEKIQDRKKQLFFKQKARNACQSLKKIISFEREGYRQSQDVQRYRRRKLPDYLLQEVKSQLPSYIIQQPLPIALTEYLDQNEKGQEIKTHKNQIYIQVHLNQYFDYIKSKQPYKSDPSSIPKTIGCKLKLVTSVAQVIKLICKMAFTQKHIQLIPNKPQNRFILKVFGSQDFWYGNTPIMNYAYIRKCLRNRQMATVILTQTKLIEAQQYRKLVFYRNRNQVAKGKYSQINWQNYENQELILWYPPFPFTKQNMKKIMLKQELLRQLQVQKEKSMQNRKQNPFSLNNNKAQEIKIKLKLMQVDFQRPRFIIKQNALANVQSRRTQTEKKVVTIKQQLICTGQCEYIFEFKMVGISSLFKIFHLHHKYTKQMQIQQKNNNFFTSHSGYNNQIFQNLKRNGILQFSPVYCSVRIMLTYGQLILKQFTTQNVIIANTVQFQQNFQYLTLSSIPLQAKLFFQIKVHSKDNINSQKLGCCGMPLFDDKGYLKQGLIQIKVWPFKQIDLRIAGCINSYQVSLDDDEKNYTRLYIRLPKYNQKIQWSLRDNQTLQNLGYRISYSTNAKFQEHSYKIEGRQRLDSLLKADPLKILQYTEKQKQILRICKSDYTKLPERYINYLYALDWSKPDHVALGLKSLNEWVSIPPIFCFGLLSPRIVDQSIRFNATQRFVQLTDDQLILYMLQLVQSLVVEANHHNPLSELLLQKSIKNPYNVGHLFFWQLKSQLQKNFVFQRYALYLQCFSMLSINRTQLIQQIKVNELLIHINNRVINQGKDSQAKNNYLATKGLQFLRKQLPDPFILSINPQKKNRDFQQNSCRVLDSKKIPLYLTTIQNKKQEVRKLSFSPSALSTSKIQLLNKTSRGHVESSYRKRIYQNNIIQQKIIFKCGDDLRQDQLTLQLLKVMDNIWLQAGYDLKMSIYRVLPIADMVGYIEVVENAQTNSRIHKDYGGSTGALDNQTTLLYLKKHNPTSKQYIRARDNFIKSSAGYLVATYVLGIGDRHSGNVMISKNGMFFHIDFGHFLGNFKQKFNIKRERSPFLFTSEYVHVMGGRQSKFFKQFQELCGIAYNLIRQKASFLINLFLIMVPNGIPQLNNYTNLQYLVDKLALNLSNQQAIQRIKEQIHQTLQKQTSRRLDNFVHEIKRTG